jgi:hypothetical protein
MGFRWWQNPGALDSSYLPPCSLLVKWRQEKPKHHLLAAPCSLLDVHDVKCL